MKARKALPALVAGMVAVSLSACGGPAQSAAPGAQTDPTTTAAAQWDINEMPRDKVREGGEFTEPMSAKVTNWNTWHVDANNSEYNFMKAPVVPAYYDYNAAGDPTINSNYLESADEKIEDGKLTVTLKLNPKAVWNDGEVIGADDWIATWKAMNGTNKQFLPAATDGYRDMESVAAGANEQEVVITYKATFPDWTQQIAAGPLRAESVATPELFNKGWSAYKNEWHSGPFKVESVDKATGTVTQVPNEMWWGEKPKLAKLVFKVVDPEGQAAGFANGELSRLDIGADPNAFKLATEAANSTVRKAAGPNFRHFTFNTKAGALTDVNVRQAIVMGLDRATIAASDLAAIDWDPKPLNNNLFVEGQTGFQDQAAATGIDFNIAGAKKKLEDAGWTMNATSGFYEKDAKPLSVTFAVLAGVPVSENESLQAQKMLKEIGVDLKIRSVPVAQFQDGSLLGQGKFDIVAFSWMGTPYPLGNIDQIYGRGSESNYAQLSMPKVDDVFKQIAVELDKPKRLAMADQVAKEIWTNVHTLPLYQRPMLIGVRSDLANIGAFAFGTPKWENIGYVAE